MHAASPIAVTVGCLLLKQSVLSLGGVRRAFTYWGLAQHVGASRLFPQL